LSETLSRVMTSGGDVERHDPERDPLGVREDGGNEDEPRPLGAPVAAEKERHRALVLRMIRRLEKRYSTTTASPAMRLPGDLLRAVRVRRD